MARARNSIETVQITLSSTDQVRSYLEQLLQTGVFGKNVAEAAGILIQEKIRELIKDGELEKLPPLAANSD